MQETVGLIDRRLGFDPWVRKIVWRRKWQPTPVSLPGKFHGGAWWATVHGVAKSRTQLSDFTFTFSKLKSQSMELGNEVPPAPSSHIIHSLIIHSLFYSYVPLADCWWCEHCLSWTELGIWKQWQGALSGNGFLTARCFPPYFKLRITLVKKIEEDIPSYRRTHQPTG